MNQYLRNLFVTVVGLIAFNAQAGDEPVNCQTVTSQTTVYYGNASCTAFSGGQSRTLYDYFSYSPTSLVSLYDPPFSCLAFLPFSRIEESTSTQCDYTPKANIRSYVMYDGTAYTATLRVYDGSTDRDGSISQVQFWVDGQYFGNSVPVFSTTQPKTYSIRLKVTDNDGYTDEQTRNVFVSPDNDPCWEGVVSC